MKKISNNKSVHNISQNEISNTEIADSKNKFKLFIDSFLVYGLGGIISKIIPIVMLPIITRLMPDSFYFGLNDLSSAAVSFGCAIAIMGMYDAMFRLFFEKEDEEYKKDICSTAFCFTLVISIIVFLILFFLKKPFSVFLFGNIKYYNLLYLTALSILIGSTNSIVAAPTRMKNKKGTFIIINTLSSFLSYSISVPLLIKGYYAIALPLSGVISAFVVEIIFWTKNKEWFQLKRFNFKYLNDLLKIAIPLLPNFLIYWIFNYSDRLMISKLLGAEFTGIYAVGARIGSISQLIYTAFAGGWQYFAFSTMKEDGQAKTLSSIFEYLGIISFVATMFIMSLGKLVFNSFFPPSYNDSFLVVPYLFLAPLLQMLFQIAGNQFLVIKKTWPIMFFLSLGAVINIILNFLMIPKIGIEGAGISTLVGYSMAIFITVLILKRMALINISKKFILACLLLILYFIIWRYMLYDKILISFILAIVATVINVYLYKEKLILLIKNLK